MNRGCSWDLAKQHLQDFGAGRASDGQAESQHAGFWIEQNKSFGKTGAAPRCTRHACAGRARGGTSMPLWPCRE